MIKLMVGVETVWFLKSETCEAASLKERIVMPRTSVFQLLRTFDKLLVDHIVTTTGITISALQDDNAVWENLTHFLYHNNFSIINNFRVESSRYVISGSLGAGCRLDGFSKQHLANYQSVSIVETHFRDL